MIQNIFCGCNYSQLKIKNDPAILADKNNTKNFIAEIEFPEPYMTRIQGRILLGSTAAPDQPTVPLKNGTFYIKPKFDDGVVQRSYGPYKTDELGYFDLSGQSLPKGVYVVEHKKIEIGGLDLCDPNARESLDHLFRTLLTNYDIKIQFNYEELGFKAIAEMKNVDIYYTYGIHPDENIPFYRKDIPIFPRIMDYSQVTPPFRLIPISGALDDDDRIYLTNESKIKITSQKCQGGFNEYPPKCKILVSQVNANFVPFEVITAREKTISKPYAYLEKHKLHMTWSMDVRLYPIDDPYQPYMDISIGSYPVPKGEAGSALIPNSEIDDVNVINNIRQYKDFRYQRTIPAEDGSGSSVSFIITGTPTEI